MGVWPTSWVMSSATRSWVLSEARMGTLQTTEAAWRRQLREEIFRDASTNSSRPVAVLVRDNSRYVFLPVSLPSLFARAFHVNGRYPPGCAGEVGL